MQLIKVFLQMVLSKL